MRFIDPFFVKKDSSVPRPHMKRQKQSQEIHFREDTVFAENVCGRSR